MKASGVQFWGKKASSQSKYRYVKHTVGVEERPVWVKLPNVTYMQKVIMARKLLRMKYSLEFQRDVKKMNPKDDEKSKRGLDRRKHTSYKYTSRRLKEEFSRRGKSKKADFKSKGPVQNTSVGETESEIEMIIKNNKSVNTKVDPTATTSKNWKVRDLRDAFRTTDVLEVWANFKVFSENTESSCSLRVRLMEIMRIGIYKHDWALVSKCVEGLAEEAKKNNKNPLWILWSGGFLALVNAYKSDVERVLNFGLQTRSLIPANPKRLAVEIATWLTQQGCFLKGIEVIREWDVNKGLHVFNTTKRHRDNPKRYNTELVASVFLASHAYALWKRDLSLLENGLYEGDSITVRRSGEAALIQFQLVAELAEKSGAEVTIFIEPLIELTMEFKTEFDARKLFLNYVEKNRRNYILQELYLKFLETYFPFLEEEIEIFTEHRKLYSFRRRDTTMSLMRLRNWRDRVVRQSTETTFISTVARVNSPSPGTEYQLLNTKWEKETWCKN